MKKIIFIIVSILIVLGMGLLIMRSFSKDNKIVSNIQEREVAKDSDLVKQLYKIVNQKDDLRKASLNNELLDDETIIKYVFVSLTDKDYNIRNVANVKIICEIDGVRFTSDKPCKVRVISNAKIDEYKKKLFNIDRAIDYQNFEFRNLSCKNNKKNYYCIEKPYESNSATFTVLDKVTKYNNELYIYEYYLKVNLDDADDCKKYFNSEYCSNYKKSEMPAIVDEVIINKGVYYRHVFRLGDNGNYYFKSSGIVVE